MDLLSPGLLLPILVIFFISGLAKGITGLGMVVVAMALLSTFMPPVLAAALLIAPSLVTNLWQWLAGPDLAGLSRRFAWMALGILLGTIPATVLLTRLDPLWSAHALGLALTLYALWALFSRPLVLARRDETWLSPLIGAMTGLVTGATGVLTLPAVPYLQALNLERDELVQALGLSFTASTLALAVGLSLHGAFDIAQLSLSISAIPVALAGMYLGQRIRHRIPPRPFRYLFLLTLLLLGLELASRPFF